MLACVLLMTDRPDLADAAEAYARQRFDLRHVSRHARSQRTFPDAAADLIDRGGIDVLLNYLAPMIIPGRVLRGLRQDAINMHPAPPAWPGIGSASYALYHGDRTFGVTAHRMTTQIDGGEIVRVTRFPVHPDDTCESLFERALDATLPVFYSVCDELSRTGSVSASGDRWERPAISRAEFERWMILKPTDSPDEIARKVRALAHSRFPGPFFDVDGVRVPVAPTQARHE